LTFISMTFIFPFAGSRGGFFHSGAALQPLWWVLVPVGLERIVVWVESKRNWRKGEAFRVFLIGTVFICILMSIFIFYVRVFSTRGWGSETERYRRVEDFIASLSTSKDDALIVGNPPGYFVISYRDAIAIPNEPLETVIEAALAISQLEPKPGRPFSDRQTEYISPDIYVYGAEDEYRVELNGEGLHRLRISPFYLRALYDKNSSSASTREYIRDKMRSAIWLIKSIYQRERTIKKVMESIIKFQRDFFDHGADHIKPLILKDVAEDIEMHESTVSRVTANKYVHTPHGIFELKYFFNSPISCVSGESIASVRVKNTIKKLLAGESAKKPYSDLKIVALLKDRNIHIARRTIAKYRDELGILSSSKRKEH